MTAPDPYEHPWVSVTINGCKASIYAGSTLQFFAPDNIMVIPPLGSVARRYTPQGEMIPEPQFSRQEKSP